MTASKDAMTFDGEDLFLVEGALSELQVSRTKINLLEKISWRAKQKNLAAGIAAAVSGMHGVVASSAMLGLYDGEDAYNFAGILGDQVICGVFDKADKFKDGDSIKAVVSRRGDALFAHSMLRTADNFMCIPALAFAGKKALFKGCMRVAFRFCFFLWIGISIVTLLLLHHREPLEPIALAVWWAMIAIFPPILMFPMEYWTYRTTRRYGEYASAIFSTFRFPRPDDLDIRSGLKLWMDSDPPFVGIDYRLALERHGLSLSDTHPKVA